MISSIIIVFIITMGITYINVGIQLLLTIQLLKLQSVSLLV